MKKYLILLTLAFVAVVASACETDPTEPEDRFSPDEIAPSSSVYGENIDVCYQIFPIAYADSTGDGDGDLTGIAENAEYLSETLGVDCVWLNPFNPSPSYHKYDVTDYYGIDPAFGDMDDFEAFMDVMDEHDILVIMDFVINHTSFNHVWFQRSRAGEDDYRDWYTWADDLSDYPGTAGWHEYEGEYYYGSFWDQMPELNYEHEPVREEIYRIAEFWINKGISGFRIDAAKHIYDHNQYPEGTDTQTKNVEFFKEFNAHIKNVDEDAFIVGEIWSESDQYLSNYYAGMDSAFNFKLATEIKEAVNRGRHNDVIDTLNASRASYESVRDDYIDSIFLSNHDMNRVMNTFSMSEERAALAARILFTLPGISWVYYGEELGMSGSGADPEKRQPFIWGEDNPYNTVGTYGTGHGSIRHWDDYNAQLPGVEEQLEDDGSLLNQYIELIDLKRSHAPLSSGTLETVDTGSDRFMAYTRSGEQTTYLVLHNMDSNERTTPHNLNEYTIVYDSHDFNDTGDAFELSPRSTIVLDIGDADPSLHD